MKTEIRYQGERRTVRKFLLLPRRLVIQGTDGKQIRWLEVATIEQRWVHGKWENICFSD